MSTVLEGSSYTYDKIVPFVKSLRVSGFKVGGLYKLNSVDP
jgi:hypothetical protein